MANRRAQKLWLVLISAGLALVVIEIAARLFLPAPGFEPFPANQLAGQLTPHPTRGYTLTAGFRGEAVRGARTVPVVINEDGFVGPRVPVPAPSGGDERIILAVGDSMTEGWGLLEGEAWPAQLEGRLNEAGGEPCRVLNAGVFGYGLTQMRVTAAELIPIYRPRVVVAGVYLLGWDRVVNPYGLCGGYSVRSNALPFLSADGEGFFRSSFKRPGLQALDRFLARYLRTGSFALRAAASLESSSGGGAAARPIAAAAELSEVQLRRMVRPFLDELDRLAAATRAAGVELIVLSMPIQDPLGRFDCEPEDEQEGLVLYQAELTDVLVHHCVEQQIRCVDMLPVLQSAAQGKPIFCLQDDFHWSAAANAVAAVELAKVIR